MSETSKHSGPSPDEARKEYAARAPYDFVVPGGGHGAAAVCRLLLDRGKRVAGVANPMVEMGKAIQAELVSPGLAALPGASLQNLLHCGTMVHVGAYRNGRRTIDQDRYLSGSYLLEREMKASPLGVILAMTFDKVTLVTKHSGGRNAVGGINRVLLAKGDGQNGLEYGDMVPNAMLPDAPPESAEEETRKLANAKVVDWYPAEVEHGPSNEAFNNDWVVNLLLTAGYTVDDYLRSIEQAVRHTTGRDDITAEQVVDRLVVNDPSGTSEKVQKMMRGEGIPREVKQVLLHRTPTGPVMVSPEDVKALEERGIEVVVKPMLSVETVSIRGIETEAISYQKEKLFDAIS